MNVKKNFTPEERIKRLEFAIRAFAEQSKRDKRDENLKPEAKMWPFTISEEESKTLDHLTVRALADESPGSRALFDNYGAYILSETGLEVKDFVVTETTPASIPSSPIPYDPFPLETELEWITQRDEP